MNSAGLSIIVYVLFICSTVFSETLKSRFRDPLGNDWQRWIVIEKQKEQTIVLVVEAPERISQQRFITQTIVSRRIFKSYQINKIQEMVDHYVSLKDIENRSLRYYQEKEIQPQNKAPNPLWVPVKNSWSLDDELRYAEWYKANASPTATKGAGLEFDCADYGLLPRWIYAHDHKLPIANTLAGSGKLFGHFSESKYWSGLPTDSDWKKDERFKAAMRFLFASTYTRSIFNDLYPVQINRDFVTSGAVILILRPDNTGHTQVIYNIGMQAYCSAECITVLFGNEPSRDYAYLTQATISNHTEKSGGFMRWRWPILQNGKWQLVSKTNMPGYSLDQYQHQELSFDDYQAYISDSLGIKVPPYIRVRSLAQSLTYDLEFRMTTTALGVLFCHYQYCDPFGKIYEEFSTPNRDARFREKRNQLLRLWNLLTLSEQFSIQSEFNVPLFLNVVGLPSVSDYIFNVQSISDRMSSDPGVSFSKRWGIGNTDKLDLTMLEFNMFYRGWNFRQSQVAAAQDKCFPNGENICDPNSEDVKRLSTSSLDLSLRTSFSVLKNLYSQLRYFEADQVNQVTRYAFFAEGCIENPDSTCSAYDYVFSGKDYIDQMSSDPTDTYLRRMGLPQ